MTFGEAVANLVARRALTGFVIAVWSAGATGTFVAESRATAAVIADEADLVAGGYRTLYVEPNDNLRTPLSDSDCRALADLDGVDAVIWFVDAAPGKLWAAAGPSVSVRLAGGDVVDLLAITDRQAMLGWTGEQVFVDPASAIVRHGTSRPLELIIGDTTSIADVRSVRLTSLGAGLAGNILAITAATGPVEACAVLVDDASRTLVRDSVAAAMPVGRGYVTRWALPSADRFDAPAVAFAERGSQWVWLVAAGVVAMTWAMYLRIRRADHTFYAACGLSPPRLAWLIWTELSCVVVLASATAAMSIAIVSRNAPDAAAIAVGTRAAVRATLIAWVIAGGVSVWRAVNSRVAVIRQLKDR